MYRIGQPEIDAVARVIQSGQLFRYHEASECARFEGRWAEYLGVGEAQLTSSGTAALTAALTGLGIGPGDEVIVPACTYMASAVAVLAAGAIPVIVDIDESITLSPRAVDEAVGPRTRAVIPVHMWGQPCDMDAIMEVARRHGLKVVEDACQAVGGGYRGRKLGSIGEAGAFSFNYFKVLSCGEGGAVVSSDETVMARVRCTVDCCGYFWTGKAGEERGFSASGSRASEIEGAILNAQLDRLDPMLEAMRRQKIRMRAETADLEARGFVSVPVHSPEDECGIQVMWTLPTAEQAARFQELTGAMITGRTGRHVYTNWDPILARHGAQHPEMDPFRMEANRECRKDYPADLCADSLDLLDRTAAIATDPDWDESALEKRIGEVRAAADEVLGG